MSATETHKGASVGRREPEHPAKPRTRRAPAAPPLIRLHFVHDEVIAA
jgi:hypothetical protein